jgi:hypothetical protein
MIATAIISSLAGLGHLLVSTLCPGESRVLRLAYALPAGLGLYVIMSFLGLALKAPPTLPLIGCVLVCGLVLAATYRQHGTSRLVERRSPVRLLGEAAAFAILSALIISASARMLQPVLSFDSFKQIAVAFSLYNPLVHPSSIEQLASWGFFLISLHSLAGAFDGEGFVNGLHGLIFLATLLLLIALMRLAAPSCRRRAPWLLGGAALLWGTTYFNVFHAVYIHNGMLTAMYALAVTGIAIRVLRDQRNGWIALLFLCAVSFCLTRTEAALYLFVILSLGCLLFEPPSRAARFAIACAALTAIIWQLFLLRGIGLGSDILTPGRIIALLGAMTGLLVLGALTPAVRYLLSPRLTAAIGLAAIPILITALFAIAPDATKANIYAIVTNLTSPFWAATGACVIALYLFSLQAALLALGQRAPGKAERTVLFLFLAATAVFVLILLFGTIRIPYRLGWGDSANRLMVMVVPLVLAAALAAAECVSPAGGWLEAGSARAPSTLPVTLQAALIVGVAVLLFPHITHALYPSKNLAWQADFRASGDYYADYGVDLALDSPCYRGRHYAAARGPGEHVVDLRLERKAAVERIDLCFYEKQHFTDFAIELSEDGTAWTTVFEAKNAAEDGATLDGDRWSLPITQDNAFGFLRLTYRGSEGQNRFLLRGLKVYAR